MGIGYWKGKKRKPFSEIWRRNIAKARKGKHHTKKTIKKLRDSWSIERRELEKQRNLHDKNPFYKKHHTDGARKIMSKKHKGKIFSEIHRKNMSKASKGKPKPVGFGEKISKASKENAKNNPSYGMRGKHLTKKQIKKLRVSIINYIRKVCGDVHPNVGYNEKQILDKLEIEIGYKVERNYHIKELGYFLDGYCQELNLAIEVDEKHHYDNGVLKERDQKRQKEIEDYLKCKFLRIKDFESPNLYNIS